MKKLNNIPQKGFIYNVINKLINTINELIENGGGGVVPQWLLDLVNTKASQEQVDTIEEKKADKDGVYRTFTAGNLIGREDDDTKDNNSSFVYRTTGGSANLADAAGKLLKIEGNIEMVADNQSYTLQPFCATKFKSYGFNHFNPIESNILKGYKFFNNEIVQGNISDTIILVKCVACDANNEAGYEIIINELDSVTQVQSVYYSKLKPTINQTYSLTDKLIKTTHRNSNSYLPTQNGWLAIYLHNFNETVEVDISKICVHICWSGYNDGKFEAFEKGQDIDVPVQLVHDWGLGSAANVRDIIDYQAKTWTRKVERTGLDMEVEDYPKTPVVKSDDSDRLYVLDSVNVTLENGQITEGSSISITITNINDVNTSRTATFVSRTADMDTWKYTEYETQEDPEVEPIATEYTVVTDSSKYYEGKPTTGRYVLYSQVIPNAKPNTNNAYHVVIPMMDEDIVEYHIGGGDWIINADRKLRINFTHTHNEGDEIYSVVQDLIADLESDFAYYELETPVTGSFDTNNISERWDFGVEFFDEYLHGLSEIYNVKGVNVSNVYTNFMIDDLRSIIRRDLQDKIKNIYIIEFDTEPFGYYSLSSPMTFDNTLFHYNDGTTDRYYKYIDGVYQVVPYKIKPNYYYKWSIIHYFDNLVLELEPIASEEQQYYNEYMIEFTTKPTGTPSVTFPSNIKWNAAPSIETGHTYQVSIVNGIGCICADNETV